MNNNMIRLIEKFLMLLIISAVLYSCVPLNRFNESEKAKKECFDELSKCKKDNEALVVDTTEMGAKIISLKKQIEQLMDDTVLLGKNFRNMQKLYNRTLELNKELSEASNTQLKGNAEETKKLLAKLQQSKEELQKQEDELRNLEKALDEKKTNLDKLQTELNDKNAQLEERNKRLVELESMLNKKDSAVQALKKKLMDALNQFEKDGLSIEVKNGKVYVSLDEKLLFKSGKWDVDTKGVSALKKLAGVLEQNKDINVMIEGHTDDVPYKGDKEILDNWDLSVKRATSIVRIILSSGKVDASRLTVAGRAEFLPVEKAKTPEARQKNRRTEIILTPKLDELFKIIENN